MGPEASGHTDRPPMQSLKRVRREDRWHEDGPEGGPGDGPGVGARGARGVSPGTVDKSSRPRHS